jgi:hypothetical protein
MIRQADVGQQQSSIAPRKSLLHRAIRFRPVKVRMDALLP